MSAISTERAHFYPRPPRGGRPRTDKRMFNVTANFYPRPPRGGRQFANLGEQPVKKFLSTPSARRATLRQAFAVQHYYISIHALREEGDRLADFCFCLCTDFYPRPPRGGRQWTVKSIWPKKHFYPRPPRGGRRHLYRFVADAYTISIHALREEGDDVPHAVHPEPVLFLSTPSARRATARCARLRPADEISIHALREEGDSQTIAKIAYLYLFLSTPSARRATRTAPCG